MSANNTDILYIPHGGGPMPLMGREDHEKLVRFLKEVPSKLNIPTAILVISAHWEETVPTILSHPTPELYYDYSGFPPETYQIRYPAPGASDLVALIRDTLENNGIKTVLNPKRGFDHGVFVPLKLMYPNADIPCTQISLTRGLDPDFHIRMGKAMAAIDVSGLLVLGSGFSFHNMAQFGISGIDPANIAFDHWLKETMTDPGLSPDQISDRLIHWESAPYARYCHPREEHLLPLHVCFGMAGEHAECIFNNNILGKTASAFLWRK